MGEKGSKLTDEAGAAAEQLVDALGELGDVTARKMFGGYGISESGVMFALIDSSGTVHFRVDESSVSRYADAESEKHSRMPYWSVPDAIMKQPAELVAWAGQALAVARSAKK